MSIATNLQKLETDITNAYDAVQTKGGTIPTDKNTNNLATAISSISGGGGDIDWSEIGYSGTPQTIIDGFNYAKQISDNWDSSRTNYSSYFRNNNNLMYMPLVDTSKGTNFQFMFNSCKSLTTVPQLDISKGDSGFYMFFQCSSLQAIPQLNTSNFTSFYGMFGQCESLHTIPELNFAKANDLQTTFGNCKNLKNLGGFLNLGQAYSTTQSANFSPYALYLNQSDNLTHDSLMNVINKLYDIATKGCNTQKLVLGSTNLAKLTAEEIGTATNKGWSVS